MISLRDGARAFALLLITALLLPMLPAEMAKAASNYRLGGAVSVSKSHLFIGEEFTIKYTITPYTVSGQTGTANYKFPKIVQPIPYGFAIVSYSGDIFADEVEIKYNELRISMNEFNYDTASPRTYQAAIKLVYKGKPAVHSLSQASLTYVLNDDWDNKPEVKFSAPSLTFKNRVEGPSTQLTELELEGELVAPAGVMFVGDPFSLKYTLSPSIEIERRDQSDYIVLWDISASMSQRLVPSDTSTVRRIDAARAGFQAFINRLRHYYPNDTEENYTALPNAGMTLTAEGALQENGYAASLTKSKPLKRRSGPQVGTAPRVTFLPFNHSILYDHVVEQTNNYTYLLSKVSSLSPTGAHTDVTRALHETMDYILYEREHGNPNYKPTIVMVTDGGMDTHTRINGEKYESCYCTSSKLAGQINRSVEATYDFDNLYLAMGIPLHMIRLSNPSDQGLNYTEGFHALENIASSSGGNIYRAIDPANRSYGGVNYQGTENAFIQLVNNTEATKKPWASYKDIVISQKLPSGFALSGTNTGITLTGGTLKIPLSSFEYNSGEMQLNRTVQLVYKGAAGAYALEKASLDYKANEAVKKSAIAGKTLSFKAKTPPTAEVDAPAAPDVVIQDDFLIIRGKEPAFSVKTTDAENVVSIQYAFLKEESDALKFTDTSNGTAGFGKQYELSFNSAGSSIKKRFEAYGWYKMVVKVTNSVDLSVTKEIYVLVLPELEFNLELEKTADAVSDKPVIAWLKWRDSEIRRPIAGKFGKPGLTALVEYSLGGSSWKHAAFDKLHIMRQSSAEQQLKVRITQSFGSAASPPFHSIAFKLEKKADFSINYDQKKY